MSGKSVSRISRGKMYLIAYNFIQFLGWSSVLLQFLLYALAGENNYYLLWSYISAPLTIFQTLQLIEVVHCILELVPSSPLTTFTQIISRIFVLWFICIPVTGARNSHGLPLITISWSIAEITRYLYYLFNLTSTVPSILNWCRYSFFIVLYLTGVSGELLLMKNSLPYIRMINLFTYPLPNFLNISFYMDIFVILTMLLYIPMFPPIYLYMLAQRKKALSTLKLN